MLYKNLFQLYPDNFPNNYFLPSDKLEDIRYTCVYIKYSKLHVIHVRTYTVHKTSPRDRRVTNRYLVPLSPESPRCEHTAGEPHEQRQGRR